MSAAIIYICHVDFDEKSHTGCILLPPFKENNGNCLLVNWAATAGWDCIALWHWNFFLVEFPSDKGIIKKIQVRPTDYYIVIFSVMIQNEPRWFLRKFPTRCFPKAASTLYECVYEHGKKSLLCYFGMGAHVQDTDTYTNTSSMKITLFCFAVLAFVNAVLWNNGTSVALTNKKEPGKTIRCVDTSLKHADWPKPWGLANQGS